MHRAYTNGTHFKEICGLSDGLSLSGPDGKQAILHLDGLAKLVLSWSRVRRPVKLGFASL